MKHSIACTAVLLSALAVSAGAQTPAAGAASAEGPAKIAVIAFQGAVTQTNEFQRNFGDLQKKYEPKRAQLKTLNDQIQALQKQLQTQGDTLSDVERQNRSKELNDKQKEFQRDQEDDQNDFQQDLQQTFNGVAGKVGEVLTTYAQQHGFTVVLDGGNQEAQLVLYANPGTDITKAIIDAYNLKSGVPAPAAPAASAPAAPKPAAPRPSTTHPPAQH